MAAKKHFALDIDNIPIVIEEYFRLNTQFLYDIKHSDEKGLVLKLEKGKSNGMLNLYYSRGLVSYSVQGRMKEKAEECWEYIKYHTALPNTENKTFVIRNVVKDDFDAYLECLLGINEFTLVECDTKDPNVAKRIKITGKYNATVVLTYYNNGTLYLQGRISSLYLTLIVETVSTITDTPDNVIKEFISTTTTPPIIIPESIEENIDNPGPIIGSIIAKMILSSIQMINSVVNVEDYSCYVLGIVKAMDALMSKKIIEITGTPFKTFGTHLDESGTGYIFKTHVLDSYPDLKRSIEKAYTYYSDVRLRALHIDRTALETSTILTYEDAVDIVKESLKHINNICNHW